MPGPAPKDPKNKFMKLPAEGRKGRAPKFPLGEQTASEALVWKELWTTPQAVAWERLRYVRVVARFTRLVVRAEEHDAGSRLLAEVRQMEHDLGLTPMGLRRLEWQIVEDEVNAKRAISRPSARERLLSVAQ